MPGTPIYINNGVAQDERLPKELDPSLLRIDERSSIDLLSFMGDYAKLLNYYDSKSGKLEINGTWDFFTRKPLFYIARIAAHKTSDTKGRLALSVLGNPGESLTNKIYALRLLFEIIVVRVRSMDDWIRNIDLLPAGYAFRLQSLVKDVLAPQLITLQAYNNLFVHTYRLVPYDFFDLRKTPGTNAMTRWTLDDENARVHESMVELNKTFAPPTGNSTENPELYFRELIERNYLQIAVIYQSFDNSINYLVNASLRLVEEEIARNHDTKPDMAMMLAFLKLFETAQDSLNANTGKHLDFYYNRVLQLKPQPLQPDRVYIAIDLVPGTGTYVLPQGTRFDGGKDLNGNQLTYVSTATTVLNQIRAQRFLTQQVSRNSQVSTGLKPQWITGIYSSGHGSPMDTGEASWALFGEDQLMFGEDQATMQAVTPGFAFSSPVLFLSGGQRNIEVTLTFSTDSFQRYFLPALTKVTKQRGGNNDSTFYALFENAFAVKASSATGWSPLRMQTLAYDETTCSIRFGLAADESVPAITACDSKVHGPSYQTPYPLLCFELQYGLPYYIYNFLKELVIEKSTIDVTVSGLKSIVLYNQYGPVDTSKPFQPFGVQPARGTFFMVGNRELFIKRTTGLVIDVSWQGLPDMDFKTYYANYNWDVNTSSFQVSGSYLKDYRWQAPGYRPMIESLFDTTDGSEIPLSISSFAFGPLAEPITSNHMQPSDLASPLVYNNTTESGFVKLELVSPAEGFGANLYSNALSQVVLANAKDDEKIPLPNPPYTPVANGIVLSYTASDEINLLAPVSVNNPVKPFYHIGAFATYAAIPRNVSADTTLKTLTASGPTYGNNLHLVPDFDAEGSLFIGLDQFTPPAPVSLWFQLQEKAVEQSMASPPTIRWSYLVNNVWVPFVAGNTIQDDTEGFVHSGVITFDLPSEISNTNTVMPQGLYWIRAQVNRNTNVFGNVLAIYAQVAELVYSVSSVPEQRGSLCLPASTISKTLDPVAQIKTIRQPFKSWGGSLSENEQEFRTRVSERLRHKQRASTAWDYERLVLEKYPVIYKAKCLTASTLAVLGSSEGMELVIIPGINSEGAVLAKDTIAPVFGFTMLEEVEQYLVGLSSVHARINVRNPVYEALRIRCSVCFDIDNPFYVQQLTNDINRFLSPWDNNNLNIGSGIQPSTILGYIQKLSYVKFVTGFSVIKVAFKEGKNYIFDTADTTKDDNDMLYALTPWSVFVPFSTHLIDVIDSERYISPQPTGIGMLSVGSDFVVKKIVPEDPPVEMIALMKSQAPTAEEPVDKAPLPIQTTPLFRI